MSLETGIGGIEVEIKIFQYLHYSSMRVECGYVVNLTGKERSPYWPRTKLQSTQPLLH